MYVVGLLGSVFRGKVCHHGHARGTDDQRFLANKVLPADEMAYDRTDLEERYNPISELTTTAPSLSLLLLTWRQQPLLQLTPPDTSIFLSIYHSTQIDHAKSHDCSCCPYVFLKISFWEGESASRGKRCMDLVHIMWVTVRNFEGKCLKSLCLLIFGAVKFESV